MSQPTGNILRDILMSRTPLVAAYIPQASAGLISTTDIVTVDNTQWAQANLFDNLSWNDVASICPSTTGKCGGTLNGYDLNGWTWASSQDVLNLVHGYLPSADPLTTSNGYTISWTAHSSPPWADGLLLAGFRSGAGETAWQVLSRANIPSYNWPGSGYCADATWFYYQDGCGGTAHRVESRHRVSVSRGGVLPQSNGSGAARTCPTRNRTDPAGGNTASCQQGAEHPARPATPKRSTAANVSNTPPEQQHLNHKHSGSGDKIICASLEYPIPSRCFLPSF